MDAKQQFGYLMREVQRLWRAEMDRRLVPLGLSQAQWHPLLVLYLEQRPMTQAELASRLLVEAPTLVRLLDRLSAKGWIERRACPGDRRAHHIHLTSQAGDLCGKIDRIVSEARADLLADIDEADLVRCNQVMERLKQRGEELQSPKP